MAQGVLIAFEGIDGSGKSTQWKRLGEWLKEHGRDVVLSFEPTKHPHGQALRDAWSSGRRLPVAEELRLFEEDRREHVNTLILPSLKQGKTVLLDRYYYSSAVYQGTRPGQTPEKVLQRFEAFCPPADLMLLFDLPVELALERMQDRSLLDAMEVQENLERVRAAYLTLKRPEIRVIDASAGPNQVWRRVKKIVSEALGIED